MKYNFSEIIFHVHGYRKCFAEINDSTPLSLYNGSSSQLAENYRKNNYFYIFLQARQEPDNCNNGRIYVFFQYKGKFVSSP